MADAINVWYDETGDYLEVLFARKRGYFRETDNDAVMGKVDESGRIIGFSILKGRKLKGEPPFCHAQEPLKLLPWVCHIFRTAWRMPSNPYETGTSRSSMRLECNRFDPMRLWVSELPLFGQEGRLHLVFQILNHFYRVLVSIDFI